MAQVYKYYHINIHLTMVLEKIKNIIERPKGKPYHIGIYIDGNISWSKKNNKDLSITFQKSFSKILDVIKEQIKIDIPVFTINLVSTNLLNTKHGTIIIDALINFFEELNKSEILDKHQIKVSILGKWYDMPGEVIEKIKETIEKTKDYTEYYLNLCINYDGKEEIADCCRILARKVLAGKISPEAISKEMIKENIYSSFLPPDLIIKTGKKKKLYGFLLWDSTKSKIYFSGKPWADFEIKHIQKAIEDS